MAIVQEHFEINGRDFIRTHSDAGRYVVGGVPYGEYEEATDPAEFNRSYIEGDPMPSEISDSEALSIIMGGASE